MNKPRPLLMHILDSAEFILECGKQGRAAYDEQRVIRDAILRNVEIMGEATKNLNPDFRAAHTEIPWKRIAGLRDKLIHDYAGVNYDLIWTTITNEIPDVVRFLRRLVSELQEPE